MCVIIDACARDEVFTDKPTEAGAIVREWILKQGGRTVYGGKLREELEQSTKARLELFSWWQAGLAKRYPDSAVGEEETRVRHEKLCRSNDTHVIALARVSGARVLFSHDYKSGLHTDFKNPQVLRSPRGSVYQLAQHRDLLSHKNGCPR